MPRVPLDPQSRPAQHRKGFWYRARLGTLHPISASRTPPTGKQQGQTDLGNCPRDTWLTPHEFDHHTLFLKRRFCYLLIELSPPRNILQERVVCKKAAGPGGWLCPQPAGILNRSKSLWTLGSGIVLLIWSFKTGAPLLVFPTKEGRM